MITYQTLKEFPQPDDAVELTDEERSEISIKQGIVARFVREQLSDPGLAALTGTDLWATGNIQRARLMMLGKAALISGGEILLDHWDLIEAELAIAWHVHAAHIDESAWNGRLLQMSRQLHTTNKSTDGWEPVTQLAPPALTDVKPFDVLKFCGIIGGIHPADNHKA